MKHRFRNTPLVRRFSILIALLTFGGYAWSQSAAPCTDQQVPTVNSNVATAAEYVGEFYPLWFTYEQSRIATPNQLVGPKSVTPLYQVVVAINVDTLYASAYMQLPENNPAILTVPSTNSIYSVLVLDPYGKIFNLGTKFPAGVYALEGPNGYDNSNGALPKGATVVKVPIDHPTIIFRADKYSPQGDDQTQQADTFRRTLQLQSLTDYLSADPPPSETIVASNLPFAFPFKTLADVEIAKAPLLFLSQLQEAVASPRTPPLTQAQAELSEQFNAIFKTPGAQADLAAGAQLAHEYIVSNYKDHVDANGWIDFTNIGNWSDDVCGALDRASITEYLQYGNDFTSAAYFHVFVDGSGKDLNGADGRTYVIHFPPGQPPTPTRFWSITAYTPEAIELVPNSLQKYNVASYTPGLTYNTDKSLTLYFGVKKPEGVPDANFLPVPPRKFNLMLRFYGPTGAVADKEYVPPAVEEYSAQ